MGTKERRIQMLTLEKLQPYTETNCRSTGTLCTLFVKPLIYYPKQEYQCQQINE